MKKFAAVLACLLIVLAATCAMADAVKIAVVYSDTVDDKGWCQTMDTGIKNAIAAGYDIEYTPVESVDPSAAPNTLDMLVGEYDIIIVHGAQFTTATQQVAEENPDQIFALGTSDQKLGDNIFSYMPMSEEPGYINGVIAGLTTKKNLVGIVGSSDGGDSARYVRGFITGLKAINPDCQYMLSWTGSFGDTVGAGEMANTFVAAGCDVLVGPAQQAVGALRVVDAADGVLWIAQTKAQLDDFPKVTVAAADYDYGAVVIELINRVQAGEKGNVNIPLNYNNNGFTFTYSDNVELLPEDVKAKAQEAVDLMAATTDPLDYDNALKNMNLTVTK